MKVFNGYLRLLFVTVFALSFASAQTATELAEPLRVDDAFSWKVERNSDTQATLVATVAKGYYLYRDRLTIENDDVVIDYLPEGQMKNDPSFGEKQVWNKQANIVLGVQAGASSVTFKFQGCQDGGVCYPPSKRTLSLPEVQKTSLLGSTANALSGQRAASKLPFLDQNELLSEDQAFSPEMTLTEDGAVIVRWQVASGYYLYADKIKVKPESAVVSLVKSEAETHEDEFFGQQPVYRNNAGAAKIYLNKHVGDELSVSYQGCADRGVCYPVMTRTFPLPINFVDRLSSEVVDTTVATSSDKITEALSGNMVLAIGLLLLAGVALAFTPCVLPMLPILLGMLHNQASLSRKRTVILAGAYALGMATMTALFGVIVSLLGINLQIIFQKWWLLAIFATVFAAAGVSMLGVFDINMPTGVHNKVSQWQSRHTKDGPISTFIVGALSVLVVGPCVAPPLFAVLTYASTTGDVLTSGVYLFTLGLGMGLPLIGFAVLSNKVPKTGAWSILVKQLMGWLLIAVALWLIGRLVPGSVALVMWGLWVLGVAHAKLKTDLPKIGKLKHVMVLLFASVGMLWIVGGVMGGSNPLSPFTKNAQVDYIYANNQEEVQKLIDDNEIVLIDFYADWCISCKENEAFVFTDDEVFTRLSEIAVVKVDMTDTTGAHKALLKKHKLVGPPALIVYKKGKQTNMMIGVVKKEQVLSSLKSGI